MKKVGILTFQNAHNYGASLQLYALITFLCKNGYNAEAINYVNRSIKQQYPIFPKIDFKTDRKLSMIKSTLLLPINILKNIYAFNHYRVKYKKFNKFIRKITNEKVINNFKEIGNMNDFYAFVCGSDQIWNPTLTGGLDGAYFCDFKTDAIKIAYAASMGLTELPKKEELSFQRMINNFDYIGVRENSLKEYVSKFTNKEVMVTLDPTLLLEKEDYLKMVGENTRGKYVFLYSLVEDKNLYATAENISKKLNIPIVELRYKKEYSHRKYIQVADSGPDDFLSLIKNAEIVVTNSFHGTVFSVLFEKKFYTVFNNWGSSRLETLLNKLQLGDRYIDNVSKVNLDDIIDYTRVNSQLENLKKDSKEFLLNVLRGMKTSDVLADNNKCTGCTACVNSCPVNAITMVEDENGFKYPKIDMNKCIHCNKCKKACPVNNKQGNDNKASKCYAFVSEERHTSQSGGAGAELAKEFILNDGIVYGCVLDGIRVVHKKISNIEDIIKLKGAKYVQSNLYNIIKEIKEDLNNGKKVLFIGTPCQVSGLVLALKNAKTTNLYTCDLICHGVVSPLIYEEYINHMSAKNKTNVSSMLFRDKEYGWQSPMETLVYENGNRRSYPYYKNIFYTDKCLRKSCYECKFSNLNRVSDITIGDFWGIQNTDFDYQNGRGVSNIIVNTDKGLELFNKIRNNNIVKEYDIEKGLQRNLEFPTNKPEQTDLFWNEYRDKGFTYIMYKYGGYNLKNRINCYIFNLKKDLKCKIKKVLKRG